jgi:hypothetical protein
VSGLDLGDASEAVEARWAAHRIDQLAEGEVPGDPEPDPRGDPNWWPSGELAWARWAW